MSILNKKQKKLSELDAMSAEEYKALKDAEFAEAEAFIEGIRNSDDPIYMYRDHRPVADLKQTLETATELYPDNVCYYQIMKGDKEFSAVTYREALKQIRGLGTALINIGLKDAHIGVIGQNCYEWAESYNAIVGGVGVVVPLDRELCQEDLENLCIEGEIEAVICCSDKYYNLFKEIKDGKKTGLKVVIGVNKEEHENPKKGLYSWNLLREEGMKMVDAGDRSFIDARIRNTDMAVIIFTSGTTGVAKGVMLTHKNLVHEFFQTYPYNLATSNDIFFSVLPIHHTFECTCSMLSSMYLGAAIAFCRGLKYISKDMQMIKPTYMEAVPLIYEKFYNSIIKALKKQGRYKKLKTLFALNKITSKIGINISRSAVEKIREQFGGRMRMFIAGGAKVDPDVLEFFRNLGIPTLQGYGLTETSPIVALNPDKDKYMRNDSAGRLLYGTECKIDDPDENGNGEICFRGPQVMLGYYNNPEATAAAMEDGWFHTGDLGHLDKDNYVYITGRKKNVIIAGNGKNVFPEELEEKLMRSKYIEECMVWADESGEETGSKGIYVTLKIDRENVSELLGDDIEDADAVYKVIDMEVDKVNENLPDWKSVKHIRIRTKDFIKTTGMKIKRFVEDNKLGD